MGAGSRGPRGASLCPYRLHLPGAPGGCTRGDRLPPVHPQRRPAPRHPAERAAAASPLRVRLHGGDNAGGPHCVSRGVQERRSREEGGLRLD